MNHQEIKDYVENHYKIKITSVENLEEGVTRSLLLRSTEKKYIMKFVLKSFEKTIIASLDVLTYLETKEFSSPKVILTKDGQQYTVDKDLRVVVLYDFTEGHGLDNDIDYSKLGQLLARLHGHMTSYTGPLCTHDKDYFINRYMSILEKKQVSDQKINDYKDLGNFLWHKVESLSRGFSHGDLHIGNVIKTPDHHYHLLDFDTASYSILLYDMMVLCNETDYFNFRIKDFESTVNNIDQFLLGYKDYKTLDKDEYESMFYLIGIYHYQLQATIIEIFGIECIDHDFIDKQYEWLMKWQESCDYKFKSYTQHQLEKEEK